MWQRQLWRFVRPSVLRLLSQPEHKLPVLSPTGRRREIWSSGAIAPPIMQQSIREYSANPKNLRKKRDKKLKKDKMKSYSSFKARFKLLPDGTYARAHAGKRHNASSKTKKQRRQLRRAALVHPAYAKVMKKLNFVAASL